MHQSVKLTDAIWLLQLVISSLSFMHWVTRIKPPLGFEPGSPVWEADDLPTELSFHLTELANVVVDHMITN